MRPRMPPVGVLLVERELDAELHVRAERLVGAADRRALADDQRRVSAWTQTVRAVARFADETRSAITVDSAGLRCEVRRTACEQERTSEEGSPHGGHHHTRDVVGRKGHQGPHWPVLRAKLPIGKIPSQEIVRRLTKRSRTVTSARVRSPTTTRLLGDDRHLDRELGGIDPADRDQIASLRGRSSGTRRATPRRGRRLRARAADRARAAATSRAGSRAPASRRTARRRRCRSRARRRACGRTGR